MCQFIETIRVENGLPFNLEAHLDRMRHTRAHFFNIAHPISRADIMPFVSPIDGIAKLRFLYDGTDIYEPTCTPYTPRQVHTLKAVESNNIEYAFKHSDRHALNQLLSLRGKCDDVLIVKNGHVTDTSFTNVAFFDGCQWVTPDTPLLAGTRRQHLLETGKIKARPIAIEDLVRYTHVALFNAMIDLGEIVLPIEHVVL